MTIWPDDFPVVRLQGPDGATAVVALRGAQVLSWITADGRERLYLSPQAIWDGSVSIRGGVPVCWPQFNRRGPLAKHGFARMLPWQVVWQQAGAVTLRLTDADVPDCWTHDASGHCLWPHAFVLELEVALGRDSVEIRLQVRNTGAQTMPFTMALHSYLAVDQVASLHIEGADQLRYWDAVANAPVSHPVQQGAIDFVAEVDRVYPAFHAVLRDGNHALSVEQSGNMAHTVVWNPGQALAATLQDMDADGWMRFVCVEAAHIDQPVELPPGASWTGSQTLRSDKVQ